MYMTSFRSNNVVQIWAPFSKPIFFFLTWWWKYSRIERPVRQLLLWNLSLHFLHIFLLETRWVFFICQSKMIEIIVERRTSFDGRVDSSKCKCCWAVFFKRSLWTTQTVKSVKMMTHVFKVVVFYFWYKNNTCITVNFGR